jgi:hypothetical protein
MGQLMNRDEAKAALECQLESMPPELAATIVNHDIAGVDANPQHCINAGVSASDGEMKAPPTCSINPDQVNTMGRKQGGAL